MNNFIGRYLTFSFLNLLLVGSLGIIMRYKIAFYIPFIEQKYVLHSHSHFSFAGCLTQTLKVMMLYYLFIKNGGLALKKYSWLLYANLITAYGMMISFILRGYGFYSIGFFLLSIFVSYIFAVYYWKDLNRMHEKIPGHLWLKAPLVFSVLLSASTFALAFIILKKHNKHQFLQSNQ